MSVLNENKDVAFNTESPCLELFSRWVGGKEYGPTGLSFLTDEDPKLWSLLDKMWEESPELCVKCIFYKGDCRGGAKEKRLFMVAMNWLSTKHQDIFLSNLRHVPEYRTWKDLVLIYERMPIEQITELFAAQLIKDIESMKSGQPVSLCAKWVPTEGTGLDRRCPSFLKCLRCELKCIAKDFRKNYLAPLRRHLKIVEKFMCANEWGQIDYSHVPSVALQCYREIFHKHDSERFQEWILSIKDKKGKVNVSQLFPHTVVGPYLRDGNRDELIEAQFSAMVESVCRMGSFNRALVISDTSSSMSGIPLDVSISLGILISWCMEGPFKGTMINFSESPSFWKLTGNDLYSDVRVLRSLPWGGNTNLDLVFTMILERAVEMKVPPSQMPNRLYILTDSQFDSSNVAGVSAIRRAKADFVLKGYEVPEIVCWNLRGGTETSAVSDSEPGCCNISGYSTSVLSAIMKGKIPNPFTLMKECLLGERYERLAF